MGKRVSFSGLHPKLSQIGVQHKDLEASLRLYFSPASPTYVERFAGRKAAEVAAELEDLIEEVDRTSSLTTLTAVEAAFRIDYLQRCYQKRKDPVSRAFREIHKKKRDRPSLEDEIFQVWIENVSGARSTISDLKGAFDFRHWLAHGRYWTPKFRRYDFADIFALANQALSIFA
ncbi:MAG TPA: hypothetical protein VK419_05455 [Bryobacteraceae bacterium]|nr:hypothetical protein [Bryobacteraceae bacterium]